MERVVCNPDKGTKVFDDERVRVFVYHDNVCKDIDNDRDQQKILGQVVSVDVEPINKRDRRVTRKA